MLCVTGWLLHTQAMMLPSQYLAICGKCLPHVSCLHCASYSLALLYSCVCAGAGPTLDLGQDLVSFCMLPSTLHTHLHLIQIPDSICKNVFSSFLFLYCSSSGSANHRQPLDNLPGVAGSMGEVRIAPPSSPRPSLPGGPSS